MNYNLTNIICTSQNIASGDYVQMMSCCMQSFSLLIFTVWRRWQTSSRNTDKKGLTNRCETFLFFTHTATRLKVLGLNLWRKSIKSFQTRLQNFFRKAGLQSCRQDPLKVSPLGLPKIYSKSGAGWHKLRFLRLLRSSRFYFINL